MSDQPPQGTATTMLVEKKSFSIPRFTTQGGRLIKNVRVGYETYGRLNAAGDNAILVCHYFSGSSHCAGKYRPDDELAGYWDAIIGPGKAIDTDRYFVVSADTMSNVNPKDPMVTTVGPATIDPDTGRPYGSTFPIVTIRDFVRVQRALIDHLGVRRLKCVTGPSMGAMQTLEWGAQYPELVERLIPVAGAGLQAEPYFIAEIDMWATPILMDRQLEGRRLFRRSRAGRGIAAVVEDRDRDGARAGLGAKSVRPQLDQAGRRSTRGRGEYVQRREHARCRRVAARPLRRCRASGASGARLPHLRRRSGRFGQSDPRADAVDCGAHRRSHVPGLFAAGGGAIAGARDAGAVGGNRHRRRPFGLLVRDCPGRSADRETFSRR